MVSFSRKKSAIRRRFLFFNLLGITHVCAPYSTYIPIHFDFYLSCELSLSAICLLIISTTPHIVSNQSKCFFFPFFSLESEICILTNVCGHPASSHLRPKVQKNVKRKKESKKPLFILT